MITAVGLIDQISREGYEMLWGRIEVQQYLSYGEYIEALGHSVSHSKSVGIMSLNTMVTKILPGKTPEFVYFSCFSTMTWIFIFLSVLFMSIIHVIRIRVTNTSRTDNSAKKHAKVIIETIINFLSPLLSRSVEKCLLNRSNRFNLGIYLIFSMVISINFCNYLLDYLQVELPMVKIKTIEDLAERSEMKIIVRSDSSLAAFASKGESELARTIDKKILPYANNANFKKADQLVSGLMDGSMAYIEEHLDVIQLLTKINKVNRNLSLESLHISTESASFEPYFIIVNPNITMWASMALNQM